MVFGEIHAFLSRFRPKKFTCSKIVEEDRLLGQCGKLDIVGTHLVTLAINDIG